MPKTSAARTIRVVLAYGLHVRPSQRLVSCASGFRSKITLSHNDRTASASSTLALLSLELLGECQVTVRAEGADAHDAVDAVCATLQLLASKEA